MAATARRIARPPDASAVDGMKETTMNSMKQMFRLTAVSAALLAAYCPVQAADEPALAADEPVQAADEPAQAADEPVQTADESAPAAENEEITQLTEPESWVSLGAGHWSNDRPHEGIYDGMRDSGGYGLLDAEIVKRNDDTGTWYTFTARNLGLDTRELKGEILRQGNIGLSLEYSRIPRDNPYTFNTGLQGIGSTSLIASGNPALGNAFPFTDVTLGTVRDLAQFGLYKNLMRGLDFNISFKNEEKNGTRQWGRGQEPQFAVEPIDSTTRQLEATLSYAGEKFQLSGGYYGSMYDNHHDLVTMRTNGIADSAPSNNPASPTYLSLPLDNQAHQLFLDGGYNFTSTTRGTFKLAYTQATQDEHLSTTDIQSLTLAGGPTSLDGEINTTLVQLGLTARPMEKLSVVANLRYHDVQDDTPVRRYVQSNPACASGQCVDNTPFSYTTISGKLEGTYMLPAGYSLTAGIEDRLQDRAVPVSNANGAGGADTQRVVPMRADVDEWTARLELRRSLSETVNGSAAFAHSERDGSPYVSAAAGPGSASSDLITPLNIADRNRDKVRLAMDWAALENLSVQFGYEYAQDKYPHDASRPFGLWEGTAQLYSVDGNYVVNDSWQITAWYSHDTTEASQLGSRAANGGGTGGLTNKDSQLYDTGDTVGFGLRGSASAHLKLGADVQWTFTNSEYHQTLLTAGATSGLTPLPDIKNTLTRAGLFGEYAVQKNSDVRLDLVYERWETDEWTWQFANGTPFVYSGGTSPAFTDGTTVNAKSTQESVFVGMRYIYKFQ
ncbi:MAG: MtrB/PioB family decaheme-associated outer membrane protein [Betaproteobacteria bacterium]